MKVLGIWDGHDSGAAIVVDGAVVAAANEERFSRRKLDIAFPVNAIRWCLNEAGLAPGDLDVAACTTSDLAKTLARLVPSTKERYYAVRRRKVAPGALSRLTKRLKYRITEWRGNRLSRHLSRWSIQKSLADLKIEAPVELYDHHVCHAAAAALTSGFERCLAVTIDGVGDGLAASVSTWSDGRLERIAATPASNSPGIFFEHVTNLMNMRELEDEGKVMALADYAAPIKDADNPLLAMLSADGMVFTTSSPGHALWSELAAVHWHFPSEQFAYMAQRALELAVCKVVDNAVKATGFNQVALAGGVASNIKANRLIRRLENVEQVSVFPHMGDGGLALGAALAAHLCSDRLQPQVQLTHLGLGPHFTASEAQTAITSAGLEAEEPADITAAVADLIAADQVVMWFEGAMEYGPRALGRRSILARPDRPEIRDRLNLVQKRRVWYQPFCPSLLADDATKAFSDLDGDTSNRFMTMAYEVAPSHHKALAGVVSRDWTCRPQIVAENDPGPFAELLRQVRKRLGCGALLNTSFNIHGEPLVCSPAEAVDTFLRSGADALAIEGLLVRNEITDHD